LVQPAEAIGNLASRYDTLYLLDACQSIGQLPVDAIASKADFIGGTLRKFLRGPRGGGLLYVSDKALNAGYAPLYPDMRGAEWLTEETYRVREDAKRFELWEASYSTILGGKAAIEYATDRGLDNIWKRNQQLSSLVKDELKNIGMKLQDRGKIQSSIITFSLPVKTTGEEVKQFLNSRNINVSFTPKLAAVIDFKEKGVDWVLRVSPHYYNTEDEIHALVAALKEFMQRF
jgi:selenocysteine lyase/cysteine desulfurase